MKNEQKMICSLDVRTGIAVGLSYLVCYLSTASGLKLQVLAACTGALMCMQEGIRASWKAGLTRMLGVLCGGVVGIVMVLIHQQLSSPFVLAVLCCLGVIGNMAVCRGLKMPYIAARVSTITYLLVVLTLQGNARISYAFGRVLGTLAGALCSLLVAFVWEKVQDGHKAH